MEALFQDVQSNQRIFIHGGAATPFKLIQGLLQQSYRLKDVEIIHLHTMGDATYADAEYEGVFKVANLFVGANMRRKLNSPRIDYLPCFVSEIPSLFRSGIRPLDVALVHVSPPDKHGYCSLGTSVDVTRAAVDSAKLIIAQINPQMPRVHGDGIIHISKIDKWIEVNEPIPEVAPPKLGDIELSIGKNVSELVKDGSTLQVGIGSIPDAVLKSLMGHRHLGIHSEMWSDGVLNLIQNGSVDNSRKVMQPGKCVSGFIIGSQRLYDFINDNPSVIQLDIGNVNNPMIIARNPNVVAINSAVEIDLTGQVCADSIGSRIISGVGGQLDFMRGAAYSAGGKSVIALTSRTKKGLPRIVSALKSGAGVVTTRADIHFVATEFGVADLYGKTLGERASALIQISHPDDRERLKFEWKKRNED
jgi:4-hydroxybutyrate CoA-transferase